MKNYPDIIPVFPLSGVIYFPQTNLPLNIFEQRYLNLVNDAYNKDKLMGMVQSKRENDAVYKVGCLGKISTYVDNDDGTLKGMYITAIAVTALVMGLAMLVLKVNVRVEKEFERVQSYFDGDDDEEDSIES